MLARLAAVACIGGLLVPCGLAESAVAAETGAHEKYDSGWMLAFDDDVLTLTGRDRDYTGGVAMTFAGRRAAEWPFTLDRAAAWLDALVPAGQRSGSSSAPPLHALQLGFVAFTPRDLNERRLIADDRPYASLLFLSSARSFVSGAAQPVYDTSFTVGVLGLSAVGALQRAIHQNLHQPYVPRGWDHQIASGGEPTLRATWGRQALLTSQQPNRATGYEVKWRLDASAGYLTQGGVALSGRWGRINTPWWSFSPDNADYVAQAVPVMGSVAPAGARELYLFCGIKGRVRAYNAFLEGQFRHSEVTLRSRQLEQLIGEAWLGVTWQTSNRLRVSYVARYQTREIRTGPGSRNLLWAGLMISRDR